MLGNALPPKRLRNCGAGQRVCARGHRLDAAARTADLAAAGLTGIEHIMLERRIAMTPATLRALFATFSAVRQLATEQREARLDAVEGQARRELGERFERVFRTPLYIARSPG